MNRKKMTKYLKKHTDSSKEFLKGLKDEDLEGLYEIVNRNKDAY